MDGGGTAYPFEKDIFPIKTNAVHSQSSPTKALAFAGRKALFFSGGGIPFPQPDGDGIPRLFPDFCPDILPQAENMARSTHSHQTAVVRFPVKGSGNRYPALSEFLFHVVGEFDMEETWAVVVICRNLW